MMFEKSEYFNDLKPLKIQMPFGNFYFCKSYFLSEVNEGVHFDWNLVQKIMVKAVEFYGNNSKVGYISNRINSYSTDPKTWDLVDKEFDLIVGGAIVVYNQIGFMNATLEKRFYERSIKRCTSLDEAVHWVVNLKELN